MARQRLASLGRERPTLWRARVLALLGLAGLGCLNPRPEEDPSSIDPVGEGTGAGAAGASPGVPVGDPDDAEAPAGSAGGGGNGNGSAGGAGRPAFEPGPPDAGAPPDAAAPLDAGEP